MATPLGVPEFLLQGLQGDGLRIRIRHVHDAGDSPGNRRPGLGDHIGLMGQTGVAEMHLIIDHARQQRQSSGVRHFDAGRDRDAAVDPLDPLSARQQIAFVDEPRILYQVVGHADIPGA